MEDFVALEQFMADLVRREAQEEVNQFIQDISMDGVTFQEVDDVRQQVIAAMQDPTAFSSLVRFLIASGLLEQADAPTDYDFGFLLTMLGLVGVAQQLVTTG